MKTEINKLTGNGQKQAELVMQTSMQLLPLIMNNIPQAVFWKDCDLIYLGCNQAFAEDAGFSSPAEIVGKTDFDMPWTDQAELYRADDRRVMEHGLAKINYEEPQTTPNGSTIWLSTSKIPVHENGQVIAVLGMYEDITGRKQTEKALQASEQQFHTLYDNATIGLYRTTPDGRILMINPTGLRLLGFNSFDEISKRNLEETGFEQEDARKEFREKLEREGVISDLENEWTRKDGSTIFVRESAKVFRDENGKVLYYDGSFEDITERKQAAETIKAEQQGFQTILESVRVPMLISRLSDRQVLYANQAIAQISNVNLDKLIGFPTSDFYTNSDDREKVIENLRQHGYINDLEVQFRRTDGSTYWVLLSSRIINYRGETCVLSSYVDITTLKQAEKNVRESEDRFRRFAEATVEGLIFHEQGRIVDVNPSAATMFGLSDITELIGRNMMEFIVPEFHQLVMKQMQLESVLPYEIQGIRKDGTTVPIETSTRAYKVGDRIIRASSIRDITERKQAEQAMRDSQQLLQIVMDNIPLSVFWKDTQLNYLGCNRAFAADVALASPNDVIGKSDYDMPSSDRAEHYREDDSLVIQSGIPKINYEEPQTTPDGSTNWLRTSKIPMRDIDGKVFAMLGLYEDITEQKRLQQEVVELFERRGYQVQISTEISQEIAAASELSDLFGRVVTLTKERLGYYHTQLLRYDATQNAVVLISGYGETGQKMLSSGHKLPMGKGLIGIAAASEQTILRSTLTEDPDWQPNPLLPDTKGEIAVPIKLGKQVLGVLDVQSDQAGALTENDRLLLEGLCGQIAVAIEQTRLRQEMAERLEEVNRLYQSMSHEGWKTYRHTADLPAGFMFDQAGLHPVNNEVLADELFSNVPMRVLGGEVVGTLTVANDPQHPTSPEDYVFLQQVSEQVALALESARLAAQTQSALAQSETLFESSRRLAQALDLQELVKTAVETFNIPVINGAELNMFSYDSEGELESLNVVANWWNGTGKEPGAIGSHYPKAMFSAVKLFLTSTPVFISDTSDSERMDASMLRIVQAFNIRAATFLPLFVGTHQIGVLVMHAEETHNFTEEETRLFSGLAPQIATVLENRRQYERAQQQAERESTLNIISQKIQSATTVEAVLQIAARELGHALGAPMTIAQLSMKDKN